MAALPLLLAPATGPAAVCCRPLQSTRLCTALNARRPLAWHSLLSNQVQSFSSKARQHAAASRGNASTSAQRQSPPQQPKQTQRGGASRQASRLFDLEEATLDLDAEDMLIGGMAWGAFEGDKAPSQAPSQALLNTKDKNSLKPQQRQELAIRLRREAAPPYPPGAPARPHRLYRYGLDDLRLYQAIQGARMEGYVVVVDSPEEADCVVVAAQKRTGRDVATRNAHNAAARMGIPCIQLATVSSQRLMEALAPLMGIPVPAHLVQPTPNARTLLPRGNLEEAATVLRLLQPPDDTATAAAAGILQGHGEAVGAVKTPLGVARSRRVPEGSTAQGQAAVAPFGALTLGLDAPSVEVLQGLAWAGTQAQAAEALHHVYPWPRVLSHVTGAQQGPHMGSSRNSQVSSTVNDGGGAKSSSQGPGHRATSTAAGGSGGSSSKSHTGKGSSSQGGSGTVASDEASYTSSLLACAVVWQGGMPTSAGGMVPLLPDVELGHVDVEDDRARLLPRNLRRLQGPRYPLLRPQKHGRKINERRLMRKLSQQKASW